MDKILAVMMSWQAVLLAFGAFAVLGVIRQLGTKKEDGKVVGGWAEHRFFKMWLPLYPYLFTFALAFTPGVPLPAKLDPTVAGKILFAIWCGWLSDKVYQVIKRALEHGFNMKFGADK